MLHPEILPLTPEEIKRFWGRVNKTDSCWLWTGALSHNGYGRFKMRKKIIPSTHVVWYLTYGYFPIQLMLHSCDTPACVNPFHLRQGTQKENIRESVSKGRFIRGERAPKAKLTSEQVIAIKEDPRYQEIIAREYGVWQGTVSAIKRGASWKHIKEPEVIYGL